MKYGYVLFDLDGTLLDTREGIISAAVHAMKQYGKVVPDQETLESLIGPPIQVSFQKLYGLSDTEAMVMANIFRDAYKTDKYLFRAKPYDGIYNLLQNLVDAGINVGIATYKREDYAKRLLIEKKFNKYTRFIYGSDFEGKFIKKDIIKICLENMGCKDCKQAVYVGDGESDGKSANEIGMNFIAVTYGFGFKKKEDAEKYQPIYITNDCMSIRDYFIK